MNLDGIFFRNFENSPVEDAKVVVRVELEKKPSLMVFYFDIQGRIGSQCDRCLADIMLPVQADYRLMVKMAHSLEEGETEGDDEMIFISAEDSHFDLSPYVYELVCLSLPIRKVYNCEEETKPPCNFKVLEKLKGVEPEDGLPDEGSIWDQIKKDLKN